MGFGKFLRKAVGFVAKAAPVLAGTVIGGPGAGAIVAKAVTAKKALQGIGHAIQRAKAIKAAGRTLRGSIVPLITKADSALAQRTSQLTPPGSMKTFSQATTMPGGARLAGKGKPSANVRKARRIEMRAKAKVARTLGVPRRGFKDLKALSKSWRAAGKPGRWIDWVKSH